MLPIAGTTVVRELSLQRTFSPLSALSPVLSAPTLSPAWHTAATYDASSTFPWHVLRLHVGRELITRQELIQRSIEHYLPTSITLRKYSCNRNRPKPVESTLFPGYCFVRFQDEHDQWLALSTPGVFGVLQMVKGIMDLVSHSEVEMVRAMAQMPTVEPCDALQIGKRVLINSGPMKGCDGVLARRGGALWLVKEIQFFNRAVMAKIQPEWLTALS